LATARAAGITAKAAATLSALAGGLGVSTVFIATPDLGGPDDVLAPRGLNA
jgi:hypothetical protein